MTREEYLEEGSCWFEGVDGPEGGQWQQSNYLATTNTVQCLSETTVINFCLTE